MEEHELVVGADDVLQRVRHNVRLPLKLCVRILKQYIYKGRCLLDLAGFPSLVWIKFFGLQKLRKPM